MHFRHERNAPISWASVVRQPRKTGGLSCFLRAAFFVFPRGDGIFHGPPIPAPKYAPKNNEATRVAPLRSQWFLTVAPASVQRESLPASRRAVSGADGSTGPIGSRNGRCLLHPGRAEPIWVRQRLAAGKRQRGQWKHGSRSGPPQASWLNSPGVRVHGGATRQHLGDHRQNAASLPSSACPADKRAAGQAPPIGTGTSTASATRPKTEDRPPPSSTVWQESKDRNPENSFQLLPAALSTLQGGPGPTETVNHRRKAGPFACQGLQAGDAVPFAAGPTKTRFTEPPDLFATLDAGNRKQPVTAASNLSASQVHCLRLEPEEAKKSSQPSCQDSLIGDQE